MMPSRRSVSFAVATMLWLSSGPTLAADEPSALTPAQTLAHPEIQAIFDAGSAGRCDPFLLDSTGSCPGPMDFTVIGETPGGRIAFVYGRPGTYVKPGGVCAGLELQIAGPTIGQLSSSMAYSVANVPPGACGRYRIQAVDVASCQASNYLDL